MTITESTTREIPQFPFPTAHTPTLSYWQASNRGPTSLWNHGRADPLPSNADFVIVGAGVAGASLAYFLTRAGAAGEGKSVVVLDAADVGSGASGRNGGHVAPYSWRGLDYLTRSFEDGGAGLSEADALDVIFSEYDNLQLVKDIVKSEGLDAHLKEVTRVEVLRTEEGAARNKELKAAFDAAHARSRHAGRKIAWDLVDGAEAARELSRVRDALAANKIPAASNHPHRLTTALLRLALKSNHSAAAFFSWTPVRSLSQEAGQWTLDCGARGRIAAPNVILCTNGYTRHLFPDDLVQGKGIAKFVTPYRGNAALITPPSAYSGAGALRNTLGLERGAYICPTDSGLVIGAHNSALTWDKPANWADIYGAENDGVVPDKFRSWLANHCRDVFTGWEEGERDGLARVWTGIMGASADMLPLIGPVPDKPGLWTAVGFHGHGMSRIPLCSRALEHHLRTGEWDARLPRVFETTAARLEKVRHAADDRPWLG